MKKDTIYHIAFFVEKQDAISVFWRFCLITTEKYGEIRPASLQVYDIMTAKQKQAAAKQTFVFVAVLTSKHRREAAERALKARVCEFMIQ